MTTRRDLTNDIPFLIHRLDNTIQLIDEYSARHGFEAAQLSHDLELVRARLINEQRHDEIERRNLLFACGVAS